jgi:alpha-methylacyl-CoA racemase
MMTDRGRAGSASDDAGGARGPLAGVRVVALAGMGPLPFASMLLADMGADVVRISRPANRAARPLAQADALDPAYDLVNRGVQSVAVDLKSPDGVAAVVRLAARADIFLEGFRPGVVERLGLGPDELLAANPALVYGRMTGYGQNGQRAHDAGHDINYVAQSGALHAFAWAGGTPSPPVNLLGDYAGGGAIAAFGLVCALLSAHDTGIGQVVDASMVDGVALLTTKLQGLRAAGLYSDIAGTNWLDGGAPFYNTYRCSDGRYIAVGALEPDFYQEFLEGLGVDTSSWPAQDDRSHWPDLREAIAAAVAKQPRDHWAAVYEGTDACVTAVLTFDEAAAHPHNVQRQVFTTVDGALHPNPAPRFSATPSPAPAAPPVAPICLDEAFRRWDAPRVANSEIVTSEGIPRA